MAEVTITDIRTNFGITATQVAEPIIAFALDKAIAETKQRIGTSVYTNLTGATPSDALQAEAVEESVSYFTIARLLRNKYLMFRASGLVKREQDAGSPAMIAGAQVINEYLTPEEMAFYAKQFRQDALNALDLVELNTATSLYLMVSTAEDRESADYVQTIPQKTSSEAVV